MKYILAIAAALIACASCVQLKEPVAEQPQPIDSGTVSQMKFISADSVIPAQSADAAALASVAGVRLRVPIRTGFSSEIYYVGDTIAPYINGGFALTLPNTVDSAHLKSFAPLIPNGYIMGNVIRTANASRARCIIAEYLTAVDNRGSQIGKIYCRSASGKLSAKFIYTDLEFILSAESIYDELNAKIYCFDILPFHRKWNIWYTNTPDVGFFVHTSLYDTSPHCKNFPIPRDSLRWYFERTP